MEEKEMQTSRPNSHDLAKNANWKSLGFKKGVIRSEILHRKPLFCFSPDLADFSINHPLLQDKLVVYTMIRAEPPQLSLLLPLQG
jgi:hypothetical protein